MSRTLGRLLKEERLRVGLSQRQLAQKIHCSTSSIGYYETGREMPEDLLTKAIRVLRSPRLMMQKCYECQVCTWIMPWLDRVDCHPVTVLSVLKRELQEALEAAERVDLINKRSEADLQESDHELLQYAVEQLAELIPALYMHFGVLIDQYGLDMDDIGKRLYEKLTKKRYLSRQSAYQEVAVTG